MGHGDIIVGDASGSVLTNLTLVLGIFPFIYGTIRVRRREFLVIGLCVVLALLTLYATIEKGYISRINALFLIFSLFAYLFIIYETTKSSAIEHIDLIITKSDKSKRYHASLAISGFIGVALGSYIIIQSVIAISTNLGVQEYIISFFALSLATSLPELAVDITALKKKHWSMAIGDIIGSCIVDSTLAIGIGFFFFPQKVSAYLITPALLYILTVAIIIITIVFLRQKIDKLTGLLCFALYATAFIVLLTVWSNTL